MSGLRDELFNIPNLLTLYRLAMVPVIVILALLEELHGAGQPVLKGREATLDPAS